MPFHLDSQSRRRFLHGSAVLALTTATRTYAADAPDAETWALLSDTHIDADPAKVARETVIMADHLKRVVAEVLVEKDSLSGVIINGDCAYLEGLAGDYVTFLELLAPLREAGLPIHFTLGNHDDRDIFRSSIAAGSNSSPVEGKLCSLIETPFANLILLDSLRYVNKVEGEIGPEQLAWIATLLDRSAEKPAILIGHHYPQVFREDIIPGEDKVKISGLIDSNDLMKSLDSHPAAKAYIYGHSHTWLVKKRESGVHEINLPPTAYVFSPERPNGWVRATISKDRIDLELRCLEPSHPQHGEKQQLKFR
jgi:3',5'-cyclic-AMP phosphodiesterase